ncbi:hypothetical protein QJQ45_008167 [Haematococcus lacustris]|nr:hypothetical protein QJQ45_008167 [Haematococcus lacustris]
MQRPLELCSWKDREALTPVGKEYQQGYKRVSDRLSKGKQSLHHAAEYRRGIDGRARNNAKITELKGSTSITHIFTSPAPSRPHRHQGTPQEKRHSGCGIKRPASQLDMLYSAQASGSPNGCFASSLRAGWGVDGMEETAAGGVRAVVVDVGKQPQQDSAWGTLGPCPMLTGLPLPSAPPLDLGLSPHPLQPSQGQRETQQLLDALSGVVKHLNTPLSGSLIIAGGATSTLLPTPTIVPDLTAESAAACTAPNQHLGLPAADDPAPLSTQGILGTVQAVAACTAGAGLSTRASEGLGGDGGGAERETMVMSHEVKSPYPRLLFTSPGPTRPPARLASGFVNSPGPGKGPGPGQREGTDLSQVYLKAWAGPLRQGQQGAEDGRQAVGPQGGTHEQAQCSLGNPPGLDSIARTLGEAMPLMIPGSSGRTPKRASAGLPMPSPASLSQLSSQERDTLAPSAPPPTQGSWTGHGVTSTTGHTTPDTLRHSQIHALGSGLHGQGMGSIAAHGHGHASIRDVSMREEGLHEVEGPVQGTYSRELIRSWILDQYESTGLTRRLSDLDVQALLTQAGFPAGASSEHATVSAGQWQEFQAQFQLVLNLVRQISSVWNLEDPCVVSGFDMDRVGVEYALASEPVGTFVCRFSMSQPGCLVLSCKVLPQGPEHEDLLHAIIKVVGQIPTEDHPGSATSTLNLNLT